MGKSKSNTGIGFIDNPVNYTVNEVANPAAKNFEKAGQRQAMALGEMSRGNFNNIGNNLLEVGAAFFTGGLSMAGGFKAGESGTERRYREADEKTAATAKQAAANDAQAAADKKQGDINTVVDELVKSRKRQPGKAGTLLSTMGVAQSYGPLLTTKGA